MPRTDNVRAIAPHTFASLGLGRPLLDALAADGIDRPFPVQSATIPDILRGLDVAAQAPTGSGKTLAFGLPIIERIQRSSSGMPHALVLAPTRELARQIHDVMAPLGRPSGLRMQTFYGGVDAEPQIAAAARGIDVAIACPGRLLDLIERGSISLSQIQVVVVDEADRMADMGFLPDVRRLLDMTPDARQTLLFSATLDGDVDVLLREHQRHPVLHSAAVDDDGDVADELLPAIRHHLWSVRNDERTELTAVIIEHCGPTMVFVRTRHGADRLATRLATHRIRAAAMHGGNSQIRRDQALDDFRAGRLQALVATDVAARGVHVDDVACVVQYDLPVDPKDYVHRSGRTGRAGASGAVVSLVPPAMRCRALSVLAAAGLDDVTVERPDIEMLESRTQRASIDRALAALDGVRRPGSVGSVAFDQPRIEKTVAGAAGR